MASRRQQQVAREIQKELGQLFQKSGSGWYGNALVTITQVNVTPDLLVARIYISIFNVPHKEDILGMIEQQKSEIRYRLGNAMRHQLRRIPELEFFLDESLDHVFKIEKILKDVRPDQADNKTDEKDPEA